MYGFILSIAHAQSTDVSTSGGGSALLIGAVIGVAFLGIGLIFLKRFGNRQSSSTHPDFRRVTLLVTVPKDYTQEQEESFGTAQDPIKRGIAVAESLFSFLGGVKAQRWYQSISHGRTDHFSLEIVAYQGSIGFYVVVPSYMREFLERQIQAQYATAQVSEIETLELIHPKSVVAGTILKQRKSFVFPHMTYEDMDSDPLNGLTNTMSRLAPDESVAVQYVVRSAHPAWHDAAQNQIANIQKGNGLQAKQKSGAASIANEVFRTFFPKKNGSSSPYSDYVPNAAEQQIVERIAGKNAKAGFETNIRIVAVSSDTNRAQMLLKNMVNSFSQFTSYDAAGNGFQRGDYFKPDKVILDFIHRRFDKNRQCILSAEELASMWHLPLPWTETPNIIWLDARKSGAPVHLPTDGLLLGYNSYRGIDTEVRILPEDRRRHVYIIGKSGVGKSALIQNMAIQDIYDGKGICVIDPHGDLVEGILAQVPKNRADDVIYFNPSDTEYPIGLNMLEADTPDEMDFAAQEMISIFYKLFPPEMIGPIFEHNMRNVMLTLMQGGKGNRGTIAEIPRMFTDTIFQKKRVALVQDPVVRSFWEKEMAKTADFHKSEMLGYIISKVGRFVENAMMRNIIGQEQSGFDINDVMDNKKILLVNLSKGTTGEVNSSLLGLIIVSKLQMAALRRAARPEHMRHDFYLYIDEFQNFVTDSIATILSEARKYKLNLTMAHQYISQLLEDNNTQIRDSVFGNVGTIVSFRVGVEDAEVLEKEFEPVFNSYDLVNVEKFTAYVKLLIQNTASRPFTMHTYQPRQGNYEWAAQLKQRSRMTYGKNRTEVEKEILTRSRLAPAVTFTKETQPTQSQ